MINNKLSFEPVKDQVWSETWKQVCDQVKNRVVSQVNNQVLIQVRSPVLRRSQITSLELNMILLNL